MYKHDSTAFETLTSSKGTEIGTNNQQFPQIAEGETFDNVPTTDHIEDEPTSIHPLAFGYGILYFKKSREAKAYIASSLFNDEVSAILSAAGFAKRRVGTNLILIRRHTNIIQEVRTEDIQDFMLKYVEGITDGYSFTYEGRHYEIPPVTIREIYYRNSNNIFNEKWLQHLREHTDPILKDTEREMFYPFKNAIVSVTSSGINASPWDELKGGCVWSEQVIPYDFNLSDAPEQGHFYKFLRNVTNHDARRWQTMVTGLGYLMHHHFRESEGQAVIFYDEAITDARTPQGGSGKGLIVNAIKKLRNVTKIDGKHLDSGNRFRFEAIGASTQLVWLDDVKANWEFSILHSNLTDGWTIERKNQHQFLIAPKDSPKTVICSNSIIQGGGSTNRRRQFIIELSDHYSRQIVRGDEKPIETEHGGILWGDTWDDTDWSNFFTFMLDCARQYLHRGLIAFEGVNVEVNRFRQSTSEDFAEWVEDANLTVNEWHATTPHFNSFTSMYGEDSRLKQRGFTNWIKKYASMKGYKFESGGSSGQQRFMLQSG